MIWNIKVWQTCKKKKKTRKGANTFSHHCIWYDASFTQMKRWWSDSQISSGDVVHAFVSVCNEKLHLHVVVHAAVYQKKGSDSDRLMSFKKKQQLKHHLFNIIISYKKVFSKFYSFDHF